MKILFITSRGDIGGGVVHIMGLIQHMAQRSQVKIFLAAPDEMPLAGFFIKHTSSSQFFKIPKRRFKFFSALRLGLFCKKNQIRLIHTHGLGAEFYGRFAAYLSKADLIHTPHGIHLDRYSQLKRCVVRNFERLGLGSLKKIICVSESERNIADSLGLWPNVSRAIINNGVREVPLLSERKIQARKLLGVEDSQKIVLSIGRFDPVKNFRELMSIAQRCPSVTFWIVGDGEEFQDLKLAAENDGVCNLTFWGARTDVNNFYSAADIYLSTSIREGLPLTLIEASAYALPVICTRVPGNIDVVEDGFTGRCYSRGSVDEAVGLIQDALADLHRFAKLGLNGQERQREFFSYERCMTQHEALYAEVAA